MATSTKFRPLARLIEKTSSPFWVIDADGRLVFLSAALGDWLAIEPESLVGRRCLSGASISNDPLDYLAASLAPPPGLSSAGTASLLVQPTIPGRGPRRFTPMDTRFVRLGEDDHAVVFAFAGHYRDHQIDSDIDTAIVLRQQLDSWRRHHELVSNCATIGKSRDADRIHRQIQLAGSVRGDLIILSPPGCFAESIATFVHQSSATGEPVVTVDGPLMDAELLDASLGPAIHHLADSDQTTATAIVRSIDETPLEAQLRLGEHLDRFGHRLRLIAIAGRHPTAAVSEEDQNATVLFPEETTQIGIDAALADRLCGLRIRLTPLSERPQDIPMIATALLDRRRAGGESSAERFSRAAIDSMVIYPWPDNLQELDQAIRHAARACPGVAIGREHLPLAIRSYHPGESLPLDQQPIDLDQAVAKFESDLIRQTLKAAAGNRAEAARRLNISRARLLRKIETLDLEDV